MKTLRDTNNNNSNTNQQHFSSIINRQNLIASNESLHPVSDFSNHLQQQTICRPNNDQLSTHQVASASKLSSQNNINSNPFNGDVNQLSSMIQSYLSKLGTNQNFQSDTTNPLFYLQLMNANTAFMQQLSATQNNIPSTHHESIKHAQNPSILDNQQTPISNIDLPTGKNSQILQADSNIFVPKTRPMTQDEIAEHARLVYQRALQRNQIQQYNDFMKHFHESLHNKQQNSSIIKSSNRNEVPSVPSVSNIVSMGTFDIVDTMISSPSSCRSMKEANIDKAQSSLSLLSVDDTKIIHNTNSILDPSAPIFIPQQNQLKLDDDNETSSSSSCDSDFNDFHYLDQFLDEFYSTDNEHDNHLIIKKSLLSEITNNKYPLNHHHTLGQGDVMEETIEQPLSTTIEKQEYQYSIHDLLNRYRNPRCHLVLPEWSRLSLILPNVCSMRNHTYKIKRYFAYRRRLHDQDLNMSISIQG
ncbi:unnamed protein product [Adineta steineri]|uniref:Uncharacterized protein n=1 Tax=Adineta steineri TaxID=433720 RepID=A0A815L702_9BILA|nr:unnamed protein product [Adineta steineri]